ncbi:MAG: hypothetical protein ACI8SE_000655 [Bacteroidia bacterium]|jgi:hypothetical protein
MYKLTVNGKTMVGCNEDAWRTTSKVWFKNAENPDEYGAGFTGSRQVASSMTAPQSGMNERGLTFSRLVASYPKQSNTFLNRIKITNEVDYLTDILQKCATVEEVKKYIEQYDHSVFIDDVYIYIDGTGKYLVVEPYKLIEGNDPYYVLSNFCPSITDNDNARNLERYRKGEDFLNAHKLNASLSFCSALSDTMHVCRSRNGDGTLLTSIWDTKDGLVNLYFYHSYESTVQFKLTKELSKGDHIINIPDLFPKSLEFERLESYKTPFNTPELRVSLFVLGAFLTLVSFLLGIFAIRNKNTEVSLNAVILISVINVLLTSYLFVLATNINIYYFDAPYKHYYSNLISASSYIPFLLLLTIFPYTLFTVKRFKSVKTKSWIKAMLVSNNLIYLMLIASFGYWGLYSIWI